MLTHFDSLKPYPPSGMFFYKVGRVVKYILSDHLTTYRRENAKLNQPSSSKCPKMSQFRIILCYEQRMVKHPMQPIPKWPKTTEIHAPLTLIKGMGSKNEPKRKRVPMKTLAV